MKYSFEVPGLPVGKERPRLGKWGVYTPPRTVEYERKVKLCALAGGVRKLKGPVRLACVFFVPDRRRRDGDNMWKAVADALNEVAYDDDSQVVEWSGRLEVDADRPRAVITLEDF